MINIVLDTTNISPNVLETDNLSDFVREFDKFTKKKTYKMKLIFLDFDGVISNENQDTP